MAAVAVAGGGTWLGCMRCGRGPDGTGAEGGAGGGGLGLAGKGFHFLHWRKCFEHKASERGGTVFLGNRLTVLWDHEAFASVSCPASKGAMF